MCVLLLLLWQAGIGFIIGKEIEMKHFKRKIVIIVVIIMTALEIMGFIDANSRFPQPKEEKYSCNEWMKLDEQVDISVTDISYYSKEQFKEVYAQEDFDIKYDTIVIVMKVKNCSDHQIDFSMRYLQYITLVAYPIGYVNQGILLNRSDRMVDSGKEKEFTVVVNVSEALVNERRKEQFLKSTFYVQFSLYPIKKVFVIDNIMVNN